MREQLAEKVLVQGCTRKLAARTQRGLRSMGQQGQCGMPVPSLPAADFIVGPAAYALGGFEADLDLPAGVQPLG